jgi:hypothetical protein
MHERNAGTLADQVNVAEPVRARITDTFRYQKVLHHIGQSGSRLLRQTRLIQSGVYGGID